MKNITAGETGAYTTAVHKLLKRHPTQDNGVAYIFHGAYFLAAPWPIRNPRKASLNFEKALEVRRNTLGVCSDARAFLIQCCVTTSNQASRHTRIDFTSNNLRAQEHDARSTS